MFTLSNSASAYRNQDGGRVDSQWVADRGDSPPAHVLAAFAGNGAFTLHLISAADEFVRVEFDAHGWLSVVMVRGDTWHAVSTSLTLGGRSSLVPVATVRAARYTGDSEVEGRSRSVIGGRRRVERSVRIAADGAWVSEYQDERARGTRIVGEASGSDSIGPAEQMTRRRYDEHQNLRWELSATTEPTRGRAGILTTARIEYANNETRESKTLNYVTSEGVKEKKHFTTSGGVVVYHDGEKHEADGSVTWVWESHYPNGAVKHETENKKWTPEGGLKTTTVTVDTSPTGQKTVTTEASTQKSDFHGSVSKTWEKTTVDSAGNKTTERGVEVQNNGPTPAESYSSTTTIVHNPDGSTTITTKTVNGKGDGTIHGTTTDKNGKIVSDKTKPVVGGVVGSDDTSDDDDAGDQDDTDDTTDDDTDDDGDSGDDDTGDDGGGDDGMGWDGADEGPPSLVPGPRPIDLAELKHTPVLDAEHDAANPLGVHIAQAIAQGKGQLVIPGKQTGGWGDAGSEAPPEPVLVQTGALFVPVDVPTTDWGDWTDPHAHVAYAAHLLETMNHTGRVDIEATCLAARALAGYRIRLIAAETPLR